VRLFDSFKKTCTLIERRRVPDGEGGWLTSWVDGPTFEAAVVLDSTTGGRVAEAQGVTGIYTVTTDANAVLAFHDAFRREEDGALFRVTKVNDSTPDVASFEFNQYQAESWQLPKDGDE